MCVCVCVCVCVVLSVDFKFSFTLCSSLIIVLFQSIPSSLYSTCNLYYGGEIALQRLLYFKQHCQRHVIHYQTHLLQSSGYTKMTFSLFYLKTR